MKKLYCLIFEIIFLVLFYLQTDCIYSQKINDDFDPQFASRLQFLLDSMRTSLNYKGISAAVYIPGQGIWTGASGISHNNVPISPGMKFGVASITKTFTASLMLKLQELNILSLDDSLHKWLPKYQNVDSTITIRQLLNHTSGVFNFREHPLFEQAMDSDTGRYWTPEEVISTFINQPYFDPGEYYHYSNSNYILAGMIIKKATDTTLSYNLRQYIFNFLNLNNTYLPIEEFVPDTIAHSWHNGVDYGGYPATSWFSATWASGSVMSTAENLARWYRDLFDLQLLTQSSLDQMLTFTPQSGYIYGLGVFRYYFGGIKYYHTGSRRGYISYMGIDSAAKYTLVLLINQSPVLLFPLVDVFNYEIHNFMLTGIKKNEMSIPEIFILHQNYPNPFNPVTKIKFEIPVESYTKLTVFDILGREVAMLVNEKLKAGNYEYEWNATDYPSGTYFYKLSAYTGTENYIQSQKMMLIK